MKFTHYNDLKKFAADTFEVLLIDEVQNNLPISFIRNENGYDTSGWLLFSIKDGAGSVLLTAACTPPFNIVMYETGNKSCDGAVSLLAKELSALGFSFAGVLAEKSLANRFAAAFAGEGKYFRHMSMNIMRLDRVNDIEKAPGFCRSLREDDLFYVPYWERSFNEDCRVETTDIPAKINQARKRISKNSHFIWEDGHPVSQAVSTRNTQNGGGINGVYTPPHYRGKGYATSVVAELSKALLERGHKFCYLFADAENPVSCSIYKKIGYYDSCVYDDIKFLRRIDLCQATET